MLTKETTENIKEWLVTTHIIKQLDRVITQIDIFEGLRQ